MGRNPASITPMAPVTPRPTRPAANPNTSSVGGTAYGKVGLNYETVKPWHRWWAWRPVTTIGKKSVWGTWCYRRTVRNWNPAVNDYYEQIEYGDLFDMISSPAE